MYSKIKVYAVIACFGAAFLACSCASNQVIKEEKAEVKTEAVVSGGKTPVGRIKTEGAVKVQKEEAKPKVEATVEIKKEESDKEKRQAEPAAVKPKEKETAKRSAITASRTKAKKTPGTAAVKKSLTGNEQVDALIDRMNEAQADKAATKADMMIKTIYSGASPQIVKGTAVIKKKDKFRVHYTEPQEQFIISNGKTIWVYTPAMQQVIQQTVKSANVDVKLYTDMGNSIAHFARHSKAALTEDDMSYNLVMLPEKDKNIMYDEITARIDKKTLVPVFMGFKYEGAATEVTFTDIVNYTEAEAKNAPELADKNFTFIKPADVEEIEAADLMQGLTK